MTMKLILILTLLFIHLTYGEKDTKKTNPRDVNDVTDTAEYGSLPMIPLFVIPNTPPDADSKVPIALYPAQYPANMRNNDVKNNNQFKYGFYAPYKTPKVTPIHEPQNEAYVPQATEAPAYNQVDQYPRAEFDAAVYSIPSSNAAALAATYYKYEQAPSKSHLYSRQQVLPNTNAYASLAPVYVYPSADSAASNYQQQPKKYTTYEPENNLPIQYLIKYVPVPYTVSSPSSAEQYQAAPENAYITPKPLTLPKSKSPVHVASSANSVTYFSSTETYPEYANNVDAYAPAAAGGANDQSPYLLKSYMQPTNYKHYDKSAYSKKYSAPTSYVLASIGKSATAHYATTIRHDIPSESNNNNHHHHHHQHPHHEQSYATKLALVPLTVDKYIAQDNYNGTSADDVRSYSDGEYSQPAPLYSLPAALKYKTVTSESRPVPVTQLYNFPYSSPFHYPMSLYQKKDVSASISNSGSSSKTASTESRAHKSR